MKGLRMSIDVNYFKKLTVLYVEDDPIVRDNISEALKLFFNDVLIANNGEKALKLMMYEKPDLILSDIKMPRMDGFLLTHHLRANHVTIPIILISSYSDQETLLEAANSCIDGYILKPIKLDVLLSTIDKVLKRKSLKKRLLHFSEDVTYNQHTDELSHKRKSIDLGKKERTLLKYFINNANRTIGKEELITSIWEIDDVTESALKNLLNRLRSKIGSDLIISVKGSGWRLKQFVEEN